ncbi:hypothetical protein PENTCL1PPCAC_28804, partial [Pristionchus entomophagus]
QIIGIGINCSDPKEGVSQIDEIVKLDWTNAGKHIFIYPNSGEAYVDGRFEGEKTALRTFVQAWKDAGAIAIGGCCRIGTDEMKQIKQVVDDIN